MTVARKHKMDAKALDRLSKTPNRATCFKCDSKRDKRNPMAICFECKKKFCFDDIWALQVNNKMGENTIVRDICDNCRMKYKYSTI